MGINSTLFGQAITFAIFVWFTMKFVWPMIIHAIEEREQKIADSLAAAERGRYELEKVQQQIKADMNKAKEDALAIIDKAHQRAEAVIVEAEKKAKEKYEQIINAGQAALLQQEFKLKEDLKKEIVTIAVLGAEKIIKKNIDGKAQNDLIGDLLGRL